MSVDITKANEVKITGVLATEQVSATFSKQVLQINAKDTKDNQWKTATMEIYIKPDLTAQVGAQDGDKIYLEGWLAFNFWNGRSFPRIVATSIQVVEKGGQQQAQQQAQQPQQSAQNYNAPQNVGPAPTGAPTAPTIPGVPGVPGVPGIPTPGA